MTELLTQIDAEIARRRAEIEALQEARQKLAGIMAPAKMLALPAPAKKKAGRGARQKRDRPKARAGSVTKEVNGIDVELTPREAALLEAIDAAPEGEFASRESLLEIFRTPGNLGFYLNALRRRLAPAGVTVKNYHGYGVRLERIEDAK